jgi:hypothetical protein
MGGENTEVERTKVILLNPDIVTDQMLVLSLLW